MGSAFAAEPWGHRAIIEDGHKLVLCALADPDRVCHLNYEECPRSEPHDISECGMFDTIQLTPPRPAMTDRTKEEGMTPEQIDEYRNAPSGIGPHADQWTDKPHRLVYDLCKALTTLQQEKATLDDMVHQEFVAREQAEAGRDELLAMVESLQQEKAVLEGGWDAETVKRQVADFNAVCDVARKERERAEQAEREVARLLNGWETAERDGDDEARRREQAEADNRRLEDENMRLRGTPIAFLHKQLAASEAEARRLREALVGAAQAINAHLALCVSRPDWGLQAARDAINAVFVATPPAQEDESTQPGPKRAAACVACGQPLKPYSPNDTSTWRIDDFCSARCKRRGNPPTQTSGAATVGNPVDRVRGGDCGAPSMNCIHAIGGVCAACQAAQEEAR
jgi:hypothetical protein